MTRRLVLCCILPNQSSLYMVQKLFTCANLLSAVTISSSGEINHKSASCYIVLHDTVLYPTPCWQEYPATCLLN
jgi:hypothetical protein